MADKQVKIKVVTEADSKKLDDLKKKVEDVDGKNINVGVNADDTEIKNVSKEISDIDGETVNTDIHADDSEIINAQKEIDNMKGESVDVKINVDTSQIKKAQKESSSLGKSFNNTLGDTQNAVTGLVSSLAGKSIWDVVYGTSVKAETNKVLLRGMSDSTIAFEDFYKTVDTTTDNSLISMQSLIPGLNGIQKATGATGQEISNITPKVAAFGQYVLALTGSEAQAESAMFDLSKGIKGAWASLDQYGITEESLMKTGLWSGKEDDIEGYMAAVEAVTGSTDELMQTTTGLEALIGKSFSRAGKKLGATLLPVIQNLLRGFLSLDNATGGWLSTALLLTGGALTFLISFLSMAGQVINGIKMINDAYKALTAVEWAEAVAGWASIGWILVAIAIGIALGLAILWLYNNVDWFREGVDNLVSTFQNLVSYISSSVMGTINWLSQLFNDFTNQLGLNTDNWIEAVLGFILFIPQLPFQLGLAFINAIAKTMGFGDNFIQTLWNSGVNAVNGFISSIKLMAIKLWQELQAMLKMAEDFGMKIADKMTFGGASMVTGWKYGSGEQSPGFMYDALNEELDEMTNLPNDYNGAIVTKFSRLGENMASSFSSNESKFNFNNIDTFNNSNILNGALDIFDRLQSQNILNLTLNIDSVDKRERIQEIVNIINNEIKWNNSTAGRGV